MGRNFWKTEKSLVHKINGNFSDCAIKISVFFMAKQTEILNNIQLHAVSFCLLFIISKNENEPARIKCRNSWSLIHILSHWNTKQTAYDNMHRRRMTGFINPAVSNTKTPDCYRTKIEGYGTHSLSSKYVRQTVYGIVTNRTILNGFIFVRWISLDSECVGCMSDGNSVFGRA